MDEDIRVWAGNGSLLLMVPAGVTIEQLRAAGFEDLAERLEARPAVEWLSLDPLRVRADVTAEQLRCEGFPDIAARLESLPPVPPREPTP